MFIFLFSFKNMFYQCSTGLGLLYIMFPYIKGWSAVYYVSIYKRFIAVELICSGSTYIPRDKRERVIIANA